MKLLELFDTPVNYKWTVDDPEYGGQAEFKIGRLLYIYTIADERLPSGESSWFIEFAAINDGRTAQYTNTGTGKQFLVYSTVLQLTREYTEKNGSRPLMFSADDDGRRSIYMRMLRKYLPGWKVETSGKGIFAYPPQMADAA